MFSICLSKKAWEAALEKGDYQSARSNAKRISFLMEEMVANAKTLLSLLGVPFVQAPGEAEAQAAFMNHKSLFGPLIPRL